MQTRLIPHSAFGSLTSFPESVPIDPNDILAVRVMTSRPGMATHSSLPNNEPHSYDSQLFVRNHMKPITLDTNLLHPVWPDYPKLSTLEVIKKTGTEMAAWQTAFVALPESLKPSDHLHQSQTLHVRRREINYPGTRELNAVLATKDSGAILLLDGQVIRVAARPDDMDNRIYGSLSDPS